MGWKTLSTFQYGSIANEYYNETKCRYGSGPTIMNTFLVQQFLDVRGWVIDFLMILIGILFLSTAYSSIDIPLLRRMTKFSLRSMFAAQTLIVVALVTLRTTGVNGGSMFGVMLAVGGIAIFWFVLYSIVTICLQDLFAAESNHELRSQQLPDKVVITTQMQDNQTETTDVNFDFLADGSLDGKSSSGKGRIKKMGRSMATQNVAAKYASCSTANIHPT